jgi:hypothetical protein
MGYIPCQSRGERRTASTNQTEIGSFGRRLGENLGAFFLAMGPMGPMGRWGMRVGVVALGIATGVLGRESRVPRRLLKSTVELMGAKSGPD